MVRGGRRGVQHAVVIHLVDVIARQDQHVFGIKLLDEADVLVDGVGRAAVPLAALGGHVGRQHIHAAQLLSEGELTNEQICEAIGYSRLQYFSAKFKEYYGLTLTEYRRKCRYESGEAPQGDQKDGQ